MLQFPRVAPWRDLVVDTFSVMAVFKIIASRRGAKQRSAEFEIQPMSGEVVVGDEFRCYDTHHPIDYRVEIIRTNGGTVTLFCDGFFGFDEQFVGAIIDTTTKKRGVGFHYDVA
jgi:hypothetical protein